MKQSSNTKINKVKKPLTERQIEKIVRDKALEMGYLTYKFTSPSNRGVPDRMFISPNGYLFFIEFKSEKGKLTALQSKVFEDFNKRNIAYYIMSDVKLTCELLECLLLVKKEF